MLSTPLAIRITYIYSSSFRHEQDMLRIFAEDLDLMEFSDTLVYRVVERVTVRSEEKIRIRFVGGFEIYPAPSLRSRHKEMLADWALPMSLCTSFSR